MSKKTEQLISQICTNFDGALLGSLPDNIIEVFIKYSYVCLFYKYGRQSLAREILEYMGEIQSLNFGGNQYTLYKNNIRLSPFESLMRTGVTTLKVLNIDEIPKYRADFLKTMRAFPEYKRSAGNADLDADGNPMVYVLGGFGALGNPASFHNPFVRQLRQRIKKAALLLFKEVIGNSPYGAVNLEMLIDRMMFRSESQAPSAEAWHRDVVPPEKIGVNDEIYGGWINLDAKSQFFSCIPGSHLGVSLKKLKKGFSKIPAEHIEHICTGNKQRYEIPPGHVVIFPQYIIHEVVSKKADRDMMRVFTGWRTTSETTFLHADMRDRFLYQAIIPLASGQLPPMYSANHISFLKNKPFKPIPKNDVKVTVETWSRASIKDVFVVDKIAQRFMESLKTSGVAMYAPYRESEIQEYIPSPVL